MDPNEFKFKFTVAGLLGIMWIVLVMLPPVLAGDLYAPPASVWCIFGGIFLYSLYTGVSAWRRGWKSRFILRMSEEKWDAAEPGSVPAHQEAARQWRAGVITR